MGLSSAPKFESPITGKKDAEEESVSLEKFRYLAHCTILANIHATTILYFYDLANI